MAQLNLAKARIISIDGPIAIGKTTLGEKITEMLGKDALFFPETGHMAPAGGEHPVSVWLEHPKELAAAFQMSMYCQCQSRMMLAERDLTIAKMQKRKTLIMIDRSLIGNAVFAVVNHQIKNITDVELRFYRAHLTCEPVMSLSSNDLNVQLWAPVETCARRLGVRHADDATGEDKYKMDYFFSLAKTTFCALLSNLSKTTPFPQLILNWESDATTSLRNFVEIYNAYMLESSGVPPVAIRLSHNICPPEEEQKYDAVFNFAALERHEDFFSRDVIYQVMGAISLRERYTGPRQYYIQLPMAVQSTTHSVIFPLTIF